LVTSPSVPPRPSAAPLGLGRHSFIYSDCHSSIDVCLPRWSPVSVTRCHMDAPPSPTGILLTLGEATRKLLGRTKSVYYLIVNPFRQGCAFSGKAGASFLDYPSSGVVPYVTIAPDQCWGNLSPINGGRRPMGVRDFPTYQNGSMTPLARTPLLPIQACIRAIRCLPPPRRPRGSLSPSSRGLADHWGVLSPGSGSPLDGLCPSLPPVGAKPSARSGRLGVFYPGGKKANKP